jgi:hypothetical protein
MVHVDVGDVWPHKDGSGPSAGCGATEAGTSAREATRGHVGPRVNELRDRHGTRQKKDLQFRR